MSNKRSDNKKKTRYANSVIYYKSLSCKASIYEDRIITDYCNKNGLSKSMFLTAAAMYCACNAVPAKEMLDLTSNGDDFDYRDYKDDEYNEQV
jgi:hypothetical protein